jgi:hypothetical protein
MKRITLLLALAVMNTCFAGLDKTGRPFEKRTTAMNRNYYPVAPVSTILFSDNMNGDNSVAGLVARGYTTYYRGTGPQGTTPEWYQGDPTAIVALNGPDSGYVASDYNSVTMTNDIDNWLVLPAVAVMAGDSLSFYSATIQQTAPPIYVDSIRVMFNPTGATLPEDTNWVELGRFQLDYATGDWTRMAFAAPDSGTNAHFAIRYTVAGGGPQGSNSYYVGIDQIDVFNNVAGGGFDECIGAIAIDSGFGQAVGVVMTLGPYDNTGATTGASDPVTGWECFGEPDGTASAPELNNTVWFSFVGDGNNYFVESANCAGVTNYIDDGDTQFALYTGTCGGLTPLKCNEDGPNATATTYPAGFTFGTVAGTTYYLMVDGFNATALGGGISDGQFCLQVTRVPTIACTDTSVTAGTEAQNLTNLCFGDTLTVSTTGAVAPNTGDFFGLSWIISSADISGNTDPLNDPSVIATYTFTSPAPATSTISFVHDGTASFIIPGNTYYWTPVVFGNATALTTPTLYLSDLGLDPSCTETGTSLAVNVLIQGDPLCAVGIDEQSAAAGSVNIYPSPAQNHVTVELASAAKVQGIISITDYTGREVIRLDATLNQGLNKTDLDLRGLARGTYFVSVKTDSWERNGKFLKD